MKPTLRIRWFKSKMNYQFYFHLIATNGRIVAASEGYKTKRSMNRTIALICRGIKSVAQKT